MVLKLTPVRRHLHHGVYGRTYSAQGRADVPVVPGRSDIIVDVRCDDSFGLYKVPKTRNRRRKGGRVVALCILVLLS